MAPIPCTRTSADRRWRDPRARAAAAAALVFVALLCAVPFAHAQPQTLDRLEALLQSRLARGVRDTATVRIMLDLSQEYRKQDADRALELSGRAESLARSLGDSSGLALAYTSAGITHAQQGSWVRSLNSFLRALQIKERTNDPAGTAALLSNIGVIHGKLNDEERALRYHLRAAKYFQTAGDRRGLAYTYNNIGVIYMNRGDLDQALASFNQSLVLKRALGDEQGRASTELNIGIAYARRGDTRHALESYQRAAALYRAVGDRHGLAETDTRLGQLALAQRKQAEALRYGREALEIANDIGARVIARNALKLCSDAYAASGDPTRALDYFRRYTEVKDTLFNEESSKLINQMTANYELERREEADRQNELLRKDSRLRALELERSAAELRQQKADNEILGKEREIAALRARQTEADLRTERLLALDRNNEITLLSKDRALLRADSVARTAELRRQRTFRNGSILGAVFLLAVAGMLFVMYRGKQRAADLYRQKSEELAGANEEIRRHERLMEEQAAEIERANLELRLKNTRLEELNAEKNELMGIVSHDLRHPIGAIRMLAESMLEDGRSSEYLRAKASTIHDAADNVIDMVRNLLDVNRLEAGTVELDRLPVRVPDAVRRVFEHHARWSENKRITLRLEVEDGTPAALADERAVGQVLDNLVSNAVKYSPHGSEVMVRLHSDGDTVVAAVEDRGPGFTDEDRLHLFSKYRRLSARPTGSEHSTGLGLSIVKRLMDAMGGTMSCDPREGGGTSFVVRLPAAPPDSRPR